MSAHSAGGMKVRLNTTTTKTVNVQLNNNLRMLMQTGAPYGKVNYYSKSNGVQRHDTHKDNSLCYPKVDVCSVA